MEGLERHLRAMRTRFIGSIATFTAFALLCIFVVATGNTGDTNIMSVQLVLLIASILVMPRNMTPARYPSGETMADTDRVEMIKADLNKLQMQSTFARLGYILVAVVLLVLVPFAQKGTL